MRLKILQILKVTLYNLLKLGYSFKVIDLNNVPKNGPLILAPNHVSNFDPPILWLSLDRHVNFMAKEELFNNWFLRTGLRFLGAFPVKRGKYDKTAIKKAYDLLKKEECLGLFPEGTRSKTGEMKKFGDGMAAIAIKNQATIVPVSIVGSKELFKMAKNFYVIFGEPIITKDIAFTKENVKEITEKTQNEIKKMLEMYNV